MEQMEIISLLQGEPKIKNTPMFKAFSDMNLSDQYISDFSNSLHNYKLKAGEHETQKKILDIFRINPLVAVKIMESCSVNAEELVYAFKIIFKAISGDLMWKLGENQVILNKHKVPYMALFIEAAYQNSVCDIYDTKEKFLEYAVLRDGKLHEKGIRAKYFNAYNVRHIMRHIPENRQIEFINWFWDRHCHAAAKYGKAESFAGGRVRIMMGELKEGSLWRHLENVGGQELSRRERMSMQCERDGIRHFIEKVVSEGRHVEYVRVVLGNDKFYEKLEALMGEKYARETYLDIRTLDYYDTHADEFYKTTVDVEFTSMQEHFLSKLEKGACILDFGCGSGRDAKYFLERGYVVEATDGSARMCELAGGYAGIEVKNMFFQELAEKDRYDGIWACSSILHLPVDELADVMRKMEAALRKNGIIYTSFKYGTFAGERNGRYFTDMTEESFAKFLGAIDVLEVEEQWTTSDVRPGRGEEKWFNLILRKI